MFVLSKRLEDKKRKKKEKMASSVGVVLKLPADLYNKRRTVAVKSFSTKFTGVSHHNKQQLVSGRLEVLTPEAIEGRLRSNENNKSEVYKG